ncbi:MAG: hypothetical protein KDA99_20490, partial [Planctomycetales bacterium]|nr:hypothetical protein [Planctomycetales bacterium]
TDADGRQVLRAEREFERDLIGFLSGQSLHELAPGQTLTVVLRPGRFNPPLDYDLPPGDYRATVRYRGPSQEMIDEVRARLPERKEATAWPHEVVSNSASFTIRDTDQAPNEKPLVWGPERDGLRAAIEFRLPKYVVEDASQLPGIPLKTNVRVVFHVQNVSDREITFASETVRQGDRIHVTNAAGEDVDVKNVWYSGMPQMVRWRLKPQQTAQLPVLASGLESIDEPGLYQVQYTVRFNGMQQKNAEGEVTFPLPGDWQDELETGKVLLVLRPRTGDDDERAKPPTFTSAIEFVDTEGALLEDGWFSVTGGAFGERYEDGSLSSVPVELTGCTDQQVTVSVRVPGFEEAQFYHVELKPNRKSTFTLKRSQTTRFVVVAATDGRPIANARVRFFHRTSALASSGPFPTDGISGPVWTSSDEQGRVVLESLQAINPYYEKLGDSIYYFYVEPQRSDRERYGPAFVGPVRAGQELGPVKLWPLIDVSGEIHGTPEELDRFAAEWDQPVTLTTDNPQATWMYAVSDKLTTARGDGKLTFKLTGLRAGTLRIVSNFGPRPHSVSHTYARRDPGPSDVVTTFELTNARDDIVIENR